MGSDEVAQLTARVEVLERDVGIMRGILWRSAPAAPPTPAQPVSYPPYPPPWVPGQARPRPPAPAPGLKAADEVRLAGTWFARAGALAVLVGAAFAFKYGIDRGYITEGVRVAVGLLVGLAFVAWGWWARRRGWDRFSQAVTAGGVATCYLSVLVADLAYHLISGPVTLAGLAAVTLGSGALAWAYDSLALGVLATGFGFLNPLLVRSSGSQDLGLLWGYTAILDAPVLWLAWTKGWRPLDAVARVGTWLLFLVGAPAASLPTAEAWASAFFLLFVAASFARSAGLAWHGEQNPGTDDVEIVLLAGTTLAYYVAAVAGLAQFQMTGQIGLLTFGLAAGLALLGGFARVLLPTDWLLRRGFGGLAAAATTLAVPLQFHGFAIPLGWAVEGVALTGIGTWAHSLHARVAGGAVVAGGVAATLGLLFTRYGPAHVLVSDQSAHVGAVIAALAAVAWLYSRDEHAELRRVGYPIAALAAVGLGVAWLSAEAVAHFHATVDGPGWQPLQFTLSTIWALSAAVLLAAGVATRQRWARLGALALFAVTVGKMATIDLWTLSTGQRMLAFIGLGGLLLACSLLYHRFKHLIFGEGGRTATAPSQAT